MDKKETRQLYDEIQFCQDIEKFIDNNEDHYIKPNLPDFLNELLEQKRMKKGEVISKSMLNPVYGYHIFSGHRKPSRDKLLQIAFGFGLDIACAQSLLKVAHQPVLYARDKRDSIIIFCLTKGLSLIDAEELILRMGLSSLISEKE